MKPITTRVLRAADWKLVYTYSGLLSFTIYACDALPGITIAYERHGAGKTRTVYTVHGKRTDSSTQAVRLYNAKIDQERGGRQAPGSVEQIRRARGETGL